MSTKGTVKFYDRLKPRERLPLIVAAWMRGDETDRKRLVRSAPRNLFKLPDYHGMADGIQVLALLHLCDLLNLAALFWTGSAILAERGAARGKESKKREAPVRDTVRGAAYAFTVHVEGWKRFCSELKVDADVLLKDRRGFATVRLAEEVARGMAFSPEEATAWWPKANGEGAEAPTAEAIAAGLHAGLKARMALWRKQASTPARRSETGRSRAEEGESAGRGYNRSGANARR